jgi:YegS/Rv2252/BmrU family lipid kinase
VQVTLIVRPRERMPWMEELRSRVEELRGRGHTVRPHYTFEPGDARRLAGRAAESGSELIIAGGGDGTVHEVVNGAAATGWRGTLGVVPLGTANDFAGGLGIPEELPAAFEVLEGGGTRSVDLPRVNDRYFVNVSTGGFGATATGDTPDEAKRLLGPLAYLITGVRKFSELRPSEARFSTSEGERYEGEVLLYAVGNGTQTGGGTQLTPQADFNDGRLDVVIVPGMPLLDFVGLIPRLRSGAHLEDSRVTYLRTDRLVVESQEDLSANADGEPLSGNRFEYTIGGDTLEVRVP